MKDCEKVRDDKVCGWTDPKVINFCINNFFAIAITIIMTIKGTFKKLLDASMNIYFTLMNSPELAAMGVTAPALWRSIKEVITTKYIEPISLHFLTWICTLAHRLDPEVCNQLKNDLRHFVFIDDEIESYPVCHSKDSSICKYNEFKALGKVDFNFIIQRLKGYIKSNECSKTDSVKIKKSILIIHELSCGNMNRLNDIDFECVASALKLDVRDTHDMFEKFCYRHNSEYAHDNRTNNTKHGTKNRL